MEHADDPDSKYEAEVDLATDVDPSASQSSPLATTIDATRIKLQPERIDRIDHSEEVKAIARQIAASDGGLSPMALRILENTPPDDNLDGWKRNCHRTGA